MGYIEGMMICVIAAFAAMWVNDTFQVGEYISDDAAGPTA